MTKDEDIIESLIVGGIIGAGLGALLSNKKGDGAMLGALIGAAIVATYKAYEQAKQTNIPVYIEENGSLYEMQGESKRFIRKIEKPSTPIAANFKLK